MSVLKNYIAGGVKPSAEELNELIEKYPWFEAARALADDERAQLFGAYDVDIEKLAEESEGELINRFLRKNDYRIVAEEGDVEGDIRTEAELDDEDDIVSEELAEIYLAQGLKNEAKEIYRKLSLLNSEKSIYFAEKIEKIEKNS
ncbi:MAG: hypothetical protein IKA07_07030 [Alistipes sp.]|nr:hypothetical protein [Alistipes sp.]